jgi:hypothetical protein
MGGRKLGRDMEKAGGTSTGTSEKKKSQNF